VQLRIRPNNKPKGARLLTRIRIQLPLKHAVVILGLGLCCIVSTACSDVLKNSDLLKKPPSDEAVAAEARVIDCEWKAADQYDDNRYKTFSELAQRIVDVCAVDLRNARSASGRSPNDTRIDKDEFNQAMEIIENARNRRLHPTWSQPEKKS
jgi:hypothetical protein